MVMKGKNVDVLEKVVVLLLGMYLCAFGKADGQVLGNKYQTNIKMRNNCADVWEVMENGEYQSHPEISDGNESNWHNFATGKVSAVFQLVGDYERSGVVRLRMKQGGSTWQRATEILVEQSSSKTSDFTEVCKLTGLPTENAWLDVELDGIINQQYVRLTFVPRKQNDGSEGAMALNEVEFYERTSGWEITHKHAKWFELREELSPAAKSLDTFDDDIKMFTDASSGSVTKEIQATHVYIDTIYMHRGTSVQLNLPDRMNRSSVNAYQRWYSYRRDANFSTGQTGDNAINDLLTPVDGKKAYKLAYGYVGSPLTNYAAGKEGEADVALVLDKMMFYYPTSEEFSEWFGESGVDGNYFVVGCDVSCYNDYTETFSQKDSRNSRFSDYPHYEPTLSHRILYYIVAVDGREDTPSSSSWETEGYGRLSQEDYRNDGGKYLEEYDISFPSKRFSNKTLELVALSKDARSYAIPGVEGTEDGGTLSLSLEDNTAGISLAYSSIEGENRVISFSYPDSKDNIGRQEVGDDSHATVLVRKTVGGNTYNIARYRLTFKRETSLLTQRVVEDLGDSGHEWDDEPWKDYRFRTIAYMDEHYQLLTDLNWDYDADVAGQYGNDGFYTFPMAWDYSSYAFFDGSPVDDVVPSLPNYSVPEWGYYAIMNKFIESSDFEWSGAEWRNDNARLLEGSSYHLYIDASDRPGVIARLRFDQDLCAGSELFVSAWVKSAGNDKNSADDAGMLFTIMGVDEKGRMTPLYRHSTGQIRRTDYIDYGMPGCGTGTNEWLQVYFSFINEADVDYEHYVLQVDNNSASTKGGDMYLDDVRVYLGRVNANVKQLEATCVGDSTRMNIKLDWNRLLSRTGDVAIDEGSAWRAVDFCIVDSLKFSEMLVAGKTVTEAIEAASQPIGGDGTEGHGYYYARLYYNLNFGQNKKYVDLRSEEATAEDLKNGGSLAGNNPVAVGDKQGFGFYGLTEDGLQSLAVDFYSMLSPNRPYLMLIHVPRVGEDGTEDEEPTADSFKDCQDACAIKTLFYVTSETLLKMNGQIVDPTTDFCAGQVFNFSVSLRVPVVGEGGESYINVSDSVYFDWFFGTEEELLAPQERYGNTTLWDALKAFRALYPDASGVDEGTTPPDKGTAIDHTVVDFTKGMFDLLVDYSTSHEEGQNNRLVLHRENLDIQLLEDGLELVVCPIQTLLPPSASGVSEEQWAQVCWGYLPLVLRTSGEAPQLHAGMGYWAYPTEDFNPGLRIGLKQIRSAVTAANSLTVNLRNAKYTNENVERISMVTTVEHRNYVFLVDTDDPDMKHFIPEDGTFTEFDLPVAWVDELEARRYGEDIESFDRNIMKIHFDLDGRLVTDMGNPSAGDFVFRPKEGYTYTLMVHFEEKLKDGVGNACFGQFPMEMKVVPEYLLWKGKATDNWNNDDYWERVTDAARLQKTDATFLEGNVNPNGFVPMVFSKVVIPENGKVELYKAGYEDGEGWQSERPIHIGLPTPDIQYDLVVEDTGNGTPLLKTQRFRVSLVDEIHFEPESEMLHPEYLIYSKAYVDYRLSEGVWHELASPLQGVVAGDFYTGKDGREHGEYFSPLFYEGKENSRFEPSVYQRGWQPSGARLYRLGKDAVDVAVAGNWSGLYNDVDVPYSPGTGFSLKVQDLPESAQGEAVFRLPKSDEAYTYYNKGQSNGGETVDVKEARTGGGRLATDVLYIRNPDYGSAQEGEPIRVTPEVTADGKYYLVGNPFMAGLDMGKFFEKNSDVLQSKYWMANEAGQQVAVGDESGWVSVGVSDAAFVVPPLQAFFVERKEEGGEAPEIVFTAEMQAGFSSEEEQPEAPARLYLTAVGAGGRSGHAVVDFREDATDGYDAGEDAMLFLDSHLDGIPVVYTVGGQRALSVNATQGRGLVPVGFSLEEDEAVRLCFGGTATQGGVDLYDAREKTRRTICDSMEIEVGQEDVGRYFLVRNGAEDYGSTDEDENGDVVFCTFRGGVVMVSSASGDLKAVNVYTVGGLKVEEKPLPEGSTSCRLSVKPGEVYVVEAIRNHHPAVRTKLKVE